MGKQFVQTQGGDLSLLLGSDLKLGIGVVSQALLQLLQHVLSGSAGRPNKEDVSESLEVGVVGDRQTLSNMRLGLLHGRLFALGDLRGRLLVADSWMGGKGLEQIVALAVAPDFVGGAVQCFNGAKRSGGGHQAGPARRAAAAQQRGLCVIAGKLVESIQAAHQKNNSVGSGRAAVQAQSSHATIRVDVEAGMCARGGVDQLEQLDVIGLQLRLR